MVSNDSLVDQIGYSKLPEPPFRILKPKFKRPMRGRRISGKLFQTIVAFLALLIGILGWGIFGSLVILFLALIVSLAAIFWSPIVELWWGTPDFADLVNRDYWWQPEPKEANVRTKYGWRQAAQTIFSVVILALLSIGVVKNKVLPFALKYFPEDSGVFVEPLIAVIPLIILVVLVILIYKRTSFLQRATDNLREWNSGWPGIIIASILTSIILLLYYTNFLISLVAIFIPVSSLREAAAQTEYKSSPWPGYFSLFGLGLFTANLIFRGDDKPWREIRKNDVRLSYALVALVLTVILWSVLGGIQRLGILIITIGIAVLFVTIFTSTEAVVGTLNSIYQLLVFIFAPVIALIKMPVEAIVAFGRRGADALKHLSKLWESISKLLQWVVDSVKKPLLAATELIERINKKIREWGEIKD